MQLFGILIGLLGLGVVIAGLLRRRKAGRIAKTPLVRTGQAASGAQGSLIAVQGPAACAAPLVAPISGRSCVYYEYRIVGRWKENESQKIREVADERAGTVVTVDDGSGQVAVDTSDGGDFELTQTHNETVHTQHASGIQEISVGQNLRFSTRLCPLGASYTVTEKTLSLPPRAFALGKLDGNFLSSKRFARLLLSGHTRDELLGSTVKSARMMVIGGGVALAVATVLGVVGTVL